MHTDSYNLNKDYNICNLHFSNFFYKFFTCHVFHLPNSNKSELIWVYMHIKILISGEHLKSSGKVKSIALHIPAGCS